MHDGRFTTMEEVIEFHSSGLKTSPNLDVIMLKDGKIQNGGLQMTPQEKVTSGLSSNAQRFSLFKQSRVFKSFE